MTRLIRTNCLFLAALACTGILWPSATQAVQKEKEKEKKEKVYEVPGGDGLKIEGALAAADPRDKELKNSACKIYLVKLTGGKKYVVRMNAADMEQIDAVLRIEDSTGKQLAFNDDAPGENTLNSRIDFDTPKDGTYRIIATSLNPNATGNFTVLVKME